MEKVIEKVNELVKALRCENTGDDECGSSDCPYWSGLGCMDGQLMDDAADAIEELQQIAEHYEQSAKDWWQEAREYKIKSADGLTAEESKEIINRFKSIPCGQIEQLLKRGKWITIRLNNGGSYTGCSCCEAPIPTDTMLDYIPESESKY